MSRSIKTRFRNFIDAHALLRPLGEPIKFILAKKFKLVSLLQRLWILLRLIEIRIRSRKKLVVIYRGIGIGDIVCTFPLVEEIHKQYPDHLIVYVTGNAFRAFVAKFSGADATIGTSYSLFSQPLPSVPAWVATKAHYPSYKDEMPGNFTTERSGFVLEMAASFGISLSHPRPRIRLDRAAAKAILQRSGAVASPRPYIGVHLGPAVPVKEYPFESWKRLVAKLHDELGATIFQFGGKSHSSFATEIKDPLNVQFDFRHRLDLIETTELISTMDLFLGIDSGLLHIANAVEVPSIGVFGPTDPSLVMPQTDGIGLFAKDLPCIFCHHRQPRLHWNTGCPFDIQCMRNIRVEVIFSQAKSMLKAAGLPPLVTT